jgi:hypothetical protein
MTMQLQPTRVVANFEPALLDVLDAYRRDIELWWPIIKAANIKPE